MSDAEPIPVPDTTSIPGFRIEVPSWTEITQSESECAKEFGGRIESVATGMKQNGSRVAWFNSCAAEARKAFFCQSAEWRHWAFTTAGLVFLASLVVKNKDGGTVPRDEFPEMFDRIKTTYKADGMPEKYGAADAVMVAWKLKDPLKN